VSLSATIVFLEQRDTRINLLVGLQNTDRDELKDKFCLAIFPMSHIISLVKAILNFEQNEESTGAAWARFSILIHSGPNLSLPDGVLLCLFYSSLDIEADLCLDVTVGGRFTHKPITEQVKFLENSLDKHSFSIIKPKPVHEKVMSNSEEPSSVESKHIPSLDSTHEPSPKPRTPKERVVHPSKFPIKFEDYGNYSKFSWHEKHTKEVSPKAKPSKEWLMEVKRSSEAIQILSPSTIMPCLLRGQS
jgi:hypothetical protein